MKLYRFSPIKTQEQLMDAIQHVHIACSNLCLKAMGQLLPNSGNIGIFCHYDDEYQALVSIRKELTEPSDNPQQKYFKLHQPIIFAKHEDIPETEYTHLYIRKPDPYRHHVGDLDFYLSPDEYVQLKGELEKGKVIKGARIFPRTDLDMVELYDPDVDVLGYISTNLMTKKVRTNQGESNL